VISHYTREDRAVRIIDLTSAVNTTLQRMGEPWRMVPRKVGSVLTSLGFSKRTRTNSGYEIQLDRQDADKIHQMAEHYGIERGRKPIIEELQESCDLCQAAMMRRPNKGAKSEGTTADVYL